MSGFNTSRLSRQTIPNEHQTPLIDSNRERTLRNVWTIRIVILLLWTIVYAYMVFKVNPYRKTGMTIFFDSIFFIIPFLTLFILPNEIVEIDRLLSVNSNLDAVLSQVLTVIGAVAVLGTFFVTQEKTNVHFVYLTLWLLFAFLFAMISIIPIANFQSSENHRFLYQLNIRILAGVCSLSLIGRAIYSLIESK